MDKVHAINQERIAWCCEEQVLSIEAFAERVRISPGTIEKVMAGEDTLSVR